MGNIHARQTVHPDSFFLNVLEKNLMKCKKEWDEIFAVDGEREPPYVNFMIAAEALRSSFKKVFSLKYRIFLDPQVSTLFQVHPIQLQDESHCDNIP